MWTRVVCSKGVVQRNWWNILVGRRTLRCTGLVHLHCSGALLWYTDEHSSKMHLWNFLPLTRSICYLQFQRCQATFQIRNLIYLNKSLIDLWFLCLNWFTWWCCSLPKYARRASSEWRRHRVWSQLEVGPSLLSTSSKPPHCLSSFISFPIINCPFCICYFLFSKSDLLTLAQQTAREKIHLEINQRKANLNIGKGAYVCVGQFGSEQIFHRG